MTLPIDREEVARALWLNGIIAPGMEWGEAKTLHKHRYRSQADAAIANIMEQLEEPSEATIEKVAHQLVRALQDVLGLDIVRPSQDEFGFQIPNSHEVLTCTGPIDLGEKDISRTIIAMIAEALKTQPEKD